MSVCRTSATCCPSRGVRAADEPAALAALGRYREPSDDTYQSHTTTMPPERGPFARAIRRVTRSLTGDDTAVDRCQDCREPVLPGANRCESCLDD